jgi:hypothetical protein
MKIQSTTSTHTMVKGQLTERDLLDFIKQTFTFPEGARVELYVTDTVASESGETFYVSAANPLRFEVSWSQTNKPLPEQEVPLRFVTTRPE